MRYWKIRSLAAMFVAVFSICGVGAPAQQQEQPEQAAGLAARIEPLSQISPLEPLDQDDQTVQDGFRAARAAAFARLDADGSGKIEAGEWPGRKKAFRLLDANRDGGVTLTEFQSRKAHWWNQVFENLDLDGNRALTRDEWMDEDEGFDRLDEDENGIIDRREFYNRR